MRKKTVSFITIVMLIGATACTKILDQMPNDKISGSGMWTTEDQADKGVIGVYASLKGPVQAAGIVGDGGLIGYYGFDVFGMTGQGQYSVSNLFLASVNPGNGRFSHTWKWCYTGVHRANAAIAGIRNIPMSDAKKARLIAECKILRAFFYMRLNELFGNGGIGVPLYLEPVSPNECDKGQSSEAEVWARIKADLGEAIGEPNLPNNRIDGDGRASKGAAYAMRGRANLITKNYDEAAADFAKVGECGYGLYPDYRKLFKQEQERCREMIFGIQYIEDPADYGSTRQKYCAAWNQGSKDGRGCWTDLQVTPGVVDLYEVIVDAVTVKPFRWTDFIPEWDGFTDAEDRKVFFVRDVRLNGKEIHPSISKAVADMKLPAELLARYLPEGNEARIRAAYADRDPRLAHNVVTPYADFLGVNSNSTAEGMYTMRWPVSGKYYFDQPGAEPNLNPGLPSGYRASGVADAQSKFFYIHRKFVGEGLEFMRRTDNPIDEPIIRYADVLLLWAEALVEKDDLAGAMEMVKKVRDRAGIPTMPSSFADKITARNYIRDERRRELLGEGVNFLDEIRWRTIKETKFDKQFPQMVWGGNAGGTSYQWPGDHWYTWPVPKSETEMNPNLKRTPGWIY